MSHPPAALLAAALIHNKISLEDGYHEIDQDKDGRVSLDDLLKSCKLLELGCDEGALKTLHSMMDTAGTGFADMSGWRAVLEDPEGIDAVLKSLGITERPAKRDSRESTEVMARQDSAPSLNPPATQQQDGIANGSESVNSVLAAVNYLAAALQYNNITHEDGFDELDADQDGKISLSDLQQGIASLMLPVSEATVEALHKSMDEKANGLVERDAWVRMLARAETEDVLRSRGLLPGSEGTSMGLSTGATSVGESRGLQNVGDTIAALLQFNELKLEEGFGEFDHDGDGLVSVSDLCDSAKRLDLDVSEQDLQKWHGEKCEGLDGKMTKAEWVKALDGANTQRVLQSRGVVAGGDGRGDQQGSDGTAELATSVEKAVDYLAAALQYNDLTNEDGFAELDVDKDGKLSLDELKSGFTTLSLPVAEHAVEALHKSMDEKANGLVERDAWVRMLARAETEDVLRSRGLLPGSEGTSMGLSTGATSVGESRGLQNVGDTIAALLQFNELKLEEGFGEFDHDGDGLVSVSDLCDSAKRLDLDVSEQDLQKWHGEKCQGLDGKMTKAGWVKALDGANTQRVLQSRGVVVPPEAATAPAAEQKPPSLAAEMANQLDEDRVADASAVENDALKGILFSPRAGQSSEEPVSLLEQDTAPELRPEEGSVKADLVGGDDDGEAKDSRAMGEEALRGDLRSPVGASGSGGLQRSPFEVANDTIAALLVYSGLELAAGFVEFDMDEDGEVSLEELRRRAEELNVDLDSAALATWHAESTRRGGGKLDQSAWVEVLQTANAQAVLESRGIKIGSDGAVLEGSAGVAGTDDGPPTGSSLYTRMSPQEVSDTIAALLEYNSLDKQRGFTHFDADQDDKISLADLLSTSKALQLEVSTDDLKEWHQQTNASGDGFVNVDEWCRVLANARAETIFKSRGVTAGSEPPATTTNGPAAEAVAGPANATAEEPFNLLERGNTKDLMRNAETTDAKSNFLGTDLSDSPLIGDEALRDQLRSPKGEGPGVGAFNLLERGNTQALTDDRATSDVKAQLIGLAEEGESPLMSDDVLQDKLRSPKAAAETALDDVPDLMAEAAPPPAHMLGMGDDVSDSPLLENAALQGHLLSPRAGQSQPSAEPVVNLMEDKPVPPAHMLGMGDDVSDSPLLENAALQGHLLSPRAGQSQPSAEPVVNLMEDKPVPPAHMLGMGDDVSDSPLLENAALQGHLLSPRAGEPREQSDQVMDLMGDAPAPPPHMLGIGEDVSDSPLIGNAALQGKLLSPRAGTQAKEEEEQEPFNLMERGNTEALLKDRSATNLKDKLIGAQPSDSSLLGDEALRDDLRSRRAVEVKGVEQQTLERLKLLTITFDAEFDTWTEADSAAQVRLLSEVTGVPQDSIRVMQMSRGSVVLDVAFLVDDWTGACQKLAGDMADPAGKLASAGMIKCSGGTGGSIGAGDGMVVAGKEDTDPIARITALEEKLMDAEEELDDVRADLEWELHRAQEAAAEYVMILEEEKEANEEEKADLVWELQEARKAAIEYSEMLSGEVDALKTQLAKMTTGDPRVVVSDVAPPQTEPLSQPVEVGSPSGEESDGKLAQLSKKLEETETELEKVRWKLEETQEELDDVRADLEWELHRAQEAAAEYVMILEEEKEANEEEKADLVWELQEARKAAIEYSEVLSDEVTRLQRELDAAMEKQTASASDPAGDASEALRQELQELKVQNADLSSHIEALKAEASATKQTTSSDAAPAPAPAQQGEVAELKKKLREESSQVFFLRTDVERLTEELQSTAAKLRVQQETPTPTADAASEAAGKKTETSGSPAGSPNSSPVGRKALPPPPSDKEKMQRMESVRVPKAMEQELQGKEARIKVLERELAELHDRLATMEQTDKIRKEVEEAARAAQVTKAVDDARPDDDGDDKIQRKALDAPPPENFATPLPRLPSNNTKKAPAASGADKALSRRNTDLEKQVEALNEKLEKARAEASELFKIKVEAEGLSAQLAEAKATIVKLKAELNLAKVEVESSRSSLVKLVNGDDAAEAEVEIDPASKGNLLSQSTQRQALPPPPSENFASPNYELFANRRLPSTNTDAGPPKRKALAAAPPKREWDGIPGDRQAARLQSTPPATPSASDVNRRLSLQSVKSDANIRYDMDKGAPAQEEVFAPKQKEIKLELVALEKQLEDARNQMQLLEMALQNSQQDCKERTNKISELEAALVEARIQPQPQADDDESAAKLRERLEEVEEELEDTKFELDDTKSELAWELQRAQAAASQYVMILEEEKEAADELRSELQWEVEEIRRASTVYCDMLIGENTQLRMALDQVQAELDSLKEKDNDSRFEELSSGGGSEGEGDTDKLIEKLKAQLEEAKAELEETREELGWELHHAQQIAEEYVEVLEAEKAETEELRSELVWEVNEIRKAATVYSDMLAAELDTVKARLTATEAELVQAKSGASVSVPSSDAATAAMEAQVQVLTQQLRAVATQQDSLRVQIGGALEGGVPEAAGGMQGMWEEVEQSWQKVNQMLRDYAPTTAAALPAPEGMTAAQQAVAEELARAVAEREKAERELEAMFDQHRSGRSDSQVTFEGDAAPGSQGLVVWHNGRKRGSSTTSESKAPVSDAVIEHVNMVAAALVYNQLSVLQGFSAFDADRDGRISLGDMQKSLTELEMSLTEAEVRTLHTEMDTDKDGFLSKEEWEEGLRAADYSAVLLSVGAKSDGQARGHSAMDVVKEKLRDSEARVKRAEARADSEVQKLKAAEAMVAEIQGKVKEAETRLNEAKLQVAAAKEERQSVAERAEKAEERVRVLQGELDSRKLRDQATAEQPAHTVQAAAPASEDIAARVEEEAQKRSSAMVAAAEAKVRAAEDELQRLKDERKATVQNTAPATGDSEELRTALRTAEDETGRAKSELGSAKEELEKAQTALQEAEAACDAEQSKSSELAEKLYQSEGEGQRLMEELEAVKAEAAGLRRGSVAGEDELDATKRRLREVEAERQAAIEQVQSVRQIQDGAAAVLEKLDAELKRKEAELQAKDDEMKSKVEELRAQMRAKDAAVPPPAVDGGLAAKVEELQQQVEALRQEVRDKDSEMTSKVQTLEAELANKDAELKSQADDHSKVKEGEMRAEVEKLEAEVHKLEAALKGSENDWKSQIEKLKAELEAKESDIKSKVASAKRDAEAELATRMDAAVASKESDVRTEMEGALKAQETEWKTTMEKTLQEKEVETRATVAKLEAELAQVRAQSKAAASVEELAEARKLQADAERQARSLQEDLAQSRRLQADYEKLAEERRSDLDKLKRELSTTEKSVDDRRQEADRLRRELHLATSRPTTPDPAASADLEELARLRVQVVSLEGERVRLEEAMRAARDEKAKLQGRVRRMSTENDQAGEVKALQARIAMLQEEAINARALAKAHQEAREAAEQDKALLAAKLQSQDSPKLTRELQGRLEALREDVQEARAERAKAEQDANQLRIQLQASASAPSDGGGGGTAAAAAAAAREQEELRGRVRSAEEERMKLEKVHAAAVEHKVDLEQRMKALKAEVAALHSKHEDRDAQAGREASELRQQVSEAQERTRQAQFELGVLRKVKDALEEKSQTMAGEVAEARVRIASLQKQLQAHDERSHEAVSSSRHASHERAQSVEALQEELGEVQGQLRLETQRKLLEEGRSKLLELELEAVRGQLQEAFDRRLADKTRKDGEPSVVESLMASVKSGQARYEQERQAREDLQRQLDALSSSLPGDAEAADGGEAVDAGSLHDRIRQLLRENAECHAQIRLLGSEVVGLSEALDMVTKRAQNNDIKHQQFQAKVEKFTRNLGGLGSKSVTGAVGASKAKKKRVHASPLAASSLHHSPYMEAQTLSEPRPAPNSRDMMVLRAYPYSAERPTKGRDHDGTPQRRRPESARGRVEEVQPPLNGHRALLNGHSPELPNLPRNEAWGDAPPARMPILRAGSSGGSPAVPLRASGAGHMTPPLNGHRDRDPGQPALGDVRYGNAFPGQRAPYTP